MSTLFRASELTKRPVVTVGGEDIAQIKDIVYAANGGEIGAFTLAGRGLFAGPLKVALPWASVLAVGPDAVMIETADVLVPVSEMLAGTESDPNAAGGDVLRSEVLTDDGSSLGRVADVIIGIGDVKGGQADVIGYEIDPAENLGRGRQRLLIPLPDTMAASGQHLIVPASARNYLSDDLGRFGAAVDAFRAQLAGGGN